MPLVYAIAGIRNANAAALAALAIYLYLIKEKNIIYSCVLIVAAVLMHPSVILVLPSLFLAKKSIGWKNIILIFFVVLTIPLIAKVFCVSKIPLFNRIGHLYFTFSSPGQYTNGRRFLYIDIILICIYLLSIFIRKKNKVRRISYLENFVTLYMLCVLSNTGNYDLVIRPMYVISPLSLPVAYIMFNQKWYVTGLKTRVLRLVLIGTLCGLCIWCIWEHSTILAMYF